MTTKWMFLGVLMWTISTDETTSFAFQVPSGSSTNSVPSGTFFDRFNDGISSPSCRPRLSRDWKRTTTTPGSLELSSSTALAMGKLRNKQAELQRKMAEAKRSREEKAAAASSSPSSSTTTTTETQEKQDSRLTDEEIKEMNDRKRFEQLLQSSAAMTMMRNDGNDDDELMSQYLNREQEEENVDAYTRGVDRFFEGDTAPEDPFEELVSIKSENAIGETGKKRLLPWLRNKSDLVIIVCDPRQKSTEFRDTIKHFEKELPKDLQRKIVLVNADTPAENRRLIKKARIMISDDGVGGGGMTLYSDEKMEWMRGYTALGTNRWSMTLFVLADGRIQKIVREFSSVNAANILQSVVNAAEKRRL